MFREMRRFKQQISEEECIRILKEQPRGILSMIGDNGYPQRRTTGSIFIVRKQGISWMPLLPAIRSAIV